MTTPCICLKMIDYFVCDVGNICLKFDQDYMGIKIMVFLKMTFFGCTITRVKLF